MQFFQLAISGGRINRRYEDLKETASMVLIPTAIIESAAILLSSVALVISLLGWLLSPLFRNRTPS